MIRKVKNGVCIYILLYRYRLGQCCLEIARLSESIYQNKLCYRNSEEYEKIQSIIVWIIKEIDHLGEL